MSLPPVSVQIKRKRTDEPVDFLRVHESNGKRQRRATDFVFSRQPVANDPGAVPAPDAIRRIKQLPRSNSSSSLRTPSAEPAINDAQPIHSAHRSAVPTTPSSDASHHNNPNQSLHKPTVRRFHISRSTASVSDPDIAATALKRPIVFSERRPAKRPRSADSSTPSKPQNEPSSEKSAQKEQNRPLKKPGLAARIASKSIASGKNVPFPSGATRLNSEQLAAELQAFTLQEIARNLAASEAAKPSPSKFKPKKPALRYHERHPESVISHEAVNEPEIYNVELEDDADYVIDTYIRMPADEVEPNTEDNYGLLVLDSQPDIDQFYKAHMEEEEEEEDIEEDENAENHYSADYPDEEVDSDDEFDRNAHFYYRKDLDEEYGDDEVAFSDEGDDAQRYPWAKSTWTKNKDPDAEDSSGEDEKGDARFDFTSLTLAQISSAR